jgi:hypothetical protein
MAPNIANIAQSSKLLKQDKVLMSMGKSTVYADKKATMDFMIKGEFSLLFPEIHKVFLTSDEIQAYIWEQLQVAFNTHHEQSPHIWSGPGVAPAPVQNKSSILPPKPPLFTVKEIPINPPIMSRGIQVPIADPTSAIGDDDIDLTPPIPVLNPVMGYYASPVNHMLGA